MNNNNLNHCLQVKLVGFAELVQAFLTAGEVKIQRQQACQQLAHALSKEMGRVAHVPTFHELLKISKSLQIEVTGEVLLDLGLEDRAIHKRNGSAYVKLVDLFTEEEIVQLVRLWKLDPELSWTKNPFSEAMWKKFLEEKANNQDLADLLADPRALRGIYGKVFANHGEAGAATSGINGEGSGLKGGNGSFGVNGALGANGLGEQGLGAQGSSSLSVEQQSSSPEQSEELFILEQDQDSDFLYIDVRRFNFWQDWLNPNYWHLSQLVELISGRIDNIYVEDQLVTGPLALRALISNLQVSEEAISLLTHSLHIQLIDELSHFQANPNRMLVSNSVTADLLKNYSHISSYQQLLEGGIEILYRLTHALIQDWVVEHFSVYQQVLVTDASADLTFGWKERLNTFFFWTQSVQQTYGVLALDWQSSQVSARGNSSPWPLPETWESEFGIREDALVQIAFRDGKPTDVNGFNLDQIEDWISYPTHADLSMMVALAGQTNNLRSSAYVLNPSVLVDHDLDASPKAELSELQRTHADSINIRKALNFARENLATNGELSATKLETPAGKKLQQQLTEVWSLIGNMIMHPVHDFPLFNSILAANLVIFPKIVSHQLVVSLTDTKDPSRLLAGIPATGVENTKDAEARETSFHPNLDLEKFSKVGVEIPDTAPEQLSAVETLTFNQELKNPQYLKQNNHKGYQAYLLANPDQPQLTQEQLNTAPVFWQVVNWFASDLDKQLGQAKSLGVLGELATLQLNNTLEKLGLTQVKGPFPPGQANCHLQPKILPPSDIHQPALISNLAQLDIFEGIYSYQVTNHLDNENFLLQQHSSEAPSANSHKYHESHRDLGLVNATLHPFSYLSNIQLNSAEVTVSKGRNSQISAELSAKLDTIDQIATKIKSGTTEFHPEFDEEDGTEWNPESPNKSKSPNKSTNKSSTSLSNSRPNLTQSLEAIISDSFGMGVKLNGSEEAGEAGEDSESDKFASTAPTTTDQAALNAVSLIDAEQQRPEISELLGNKFELEFTAEVDDAGMAEEEEFVEEFYGQHQTWDDEEDPQTSTSQTLDTEAQTSEAQTSETKASETKESEPKATEPKASATRETAEVNSQPAQDALSDQSPTTKPVVKIPTTPDEVIVPEIYNYRPHLTAQPWEQVFYHHRPQNLTDTNHLSLDQRTLAAKALFANVISDESIGEDEYILVSDAWREHFPGLYTDLAQFMVTREVPLLLIDGYDQDKIQENLRKPMFLGKPVGSHTYFALDRNNAFNLLGFYDDEEANHLHYFAMLDPVSVEYSINFVNHSKRLSASEKEQLQYYLRLKQKLGDSNPTVKLDRFIFLPSQIWKALKAQQVEFLRKRQQGQGSTPSFSLNLNQAQLQAAKLQEQGAQAISALSSSNNSDSNSKLQINLASATSFTFAADDRFKIAEEMEILHGLAIIDTKAATVAKEYIEEQLKHRPYSTAFINPFYQIQIDNLETHNDYDEVEYERSMARHHGMRVLKVGQRVYYNSYFCYYGVRILQEELDYQRQLSQYAEVEIIETEFKDRFWTKLDFQEVCVVPTFKVIQEIYRKAEERLQTLLQTQESTSAQAQVRTLENRPLIGDSLFDVEATRFPFKGIVRPYLVFAMQPIFKSPARDFQNNITKLKATPGVTLDTLALSYQWFVARESQVIHYSNTWSLSNGYCPAQVTAEPFTITQLETKVELQQQIQSLVYAVAEFYQHNREYLDGVVEHHGYYVTPASLVGKVTGSNIPGSMHPDQSPHTFFIQKKLLQVTKELWLQPSWKLSDIAQLALIKPEILQQLVSSVGAYVLTNILKGLHQQWKQANGELASGAMGNGTSHSHSNTANQVNNPKAQRDAFTEELIARNEARYEAHQNKNSAMSGFAKSMSMSGMFANGDSGSDEQGKGSNSGLNSGLITGLGANGRSIQQDRGLGSGLGGNSESGIPQALFALGVSADYQELAPEQYQLAMHDLAPLLGKIAFLRERRTCPVSNIDFFVRTERPLWNEVSDYLVRENNRQYLYEQQVLAYWKQSLRLNLGSLNQSFTSKQRAAVLRSQILEQFTNPYLASFSYRSQKSLVVSQQLKLLDELSQFTLSIDPVTLAKLNQEDDAVFAPDSGSELTPNNSLTIERNELTNSELTNSELTKDAISQVYARWGLVSLQTGEPVIARGEDYQPSGWVTSAGVKFFHLPPPEHSPLDKKKPWQISEDSHWVNHIRRAYRPMVKLFSGVKPLSLDNLTRHRFNLELLGFHSGAPQPLASEVSSAQNGYFAKLVQANLRPEVAATLEVSNSEKHKLLKNQLKQGVSINSEQAVISPTAENLAIGGSDSSPFKFSPAKLSSLSSKPSTKATKGKSTQATLDNKGSYTNGIDIQGLPAGFGKGRLGIRGVEVEQLEQQARYAQEHPEAQVNPVSTIWSRGKKSRKSEQGYDHYLTPGFAAAQTFAAQLDQQDNANTSTDAQVTTQVSDQLQDQAPTQAFTQAGDSSSQQAGVAGSVLFSADSPIPGKLNSAEDLKALDLEPTSTSKAEAIATKAHEILERQERERQAQQAQLALRASQAHAQGNQEGISTINLNGKLQTAYVDDPAGGELQAQGILNSKQSVLSLDEHANQNSKFNVADFPELHKPRIKLSLWDRVLIFFGAKEDPRKQAIADQTAKAQKLVKRIPIGSVYNPEDIVMLGEAEKETQPLPDAVSYQATGEDSSQLQAQEQVKQLQRSSQKLSLNPENGTLQQLPADVSQPGRGGVIPGVNQATGAVVEPESSSPAASVNGHRGTQSGGFGDSMDLFAAYLAPDLIRHRLKRKQTSSTHPKLRDEDVISDQQLEAIIESGSFTPNTESLLNQVDHESYLKEENFGSNEFSTAEMRFKKARSFSQVKSGVASARKRTYRIVRSSGMGSRALLSKHAVISSRATGEALAPEQTILEKLRYSNLWVVQRVSTDWQAYNEHKSQGLSLQAHLDQGIHQLPRLQNSPISLGFGEGENSADKSAKPSSYLGTNSLNSSRLGTHNYRLYRKLANAEQQAWMQEQQQLQEQQLLEQQAQQARLGYPIAGTVDVSEVTGATTGAYPYLPRLHDLKVKVINLDVQFSRWEKVLKQFANSQIRSVQRIEAVYAGDLNTELLKQNFDQRRYLQLHHKAVSKGDIGTALSHRKAMLAALYDQTIRDEEFVMICEDNIELISNWQVTIEKVLWMLADQPVDLINLATLEVSTQPIYLHQLASKGINIFSAGVKIRDNHVNSYTLSHSSQPVETCCYLIRKSAIRKAVESGIWDCLEAIPAMESKFFGIKTSRMRWLTPTVADK